MVTRVHGLSPREGDTVFAFLVLRLAAPHDRAALIALAGQVAALLPDAEAFVASLPDDLEATIRLVGMPWSPPATGDALDAQRALIEGAAALGIEEAWFFQTGTGLPPLGDAADDPEDADAEVELISDDDLDADDDDDASWSHGPPPQAPSVRFPVDGYPEILEELDWEDFGIACKLAGPWTAGEATVLLGFHAMWLAPYGGRYRNARVTIDERRHAAHLWVDRFAVPCSPREQVHHLLWILSKLDEIIPVLHARFAGATMGQKYGNLVGDDSESFVLGGNPLLAVHMIGGERGVDTWMAEQTTWSNEELAQMLRELAVDLATRESPDDEDDAAEDEPDDDDEDDADDRDVAVAAVAAPAPAGAEPAAAGDDDIELDVDAMFEAAFGDAGGAPAPAAAAAGASMALLADDDADDDADDADLEAFSAGVPAGATGRRTHRPVPQPSTLIIAAGELLAARARAGLLDPRSVARLRAVLATGDVAEPRRATVAAILSAAGDRALQPDDDGVN